MREIRRGRPQQRRAVGQRFGIRLSKIGRGALEQAVRAAVADDPLSAELMDAMLTERAAL